MKQNPNETQDNEPTDSREIGEISTNNSAVYEEELRQLDESVRLIHTDVYALNMTVVWVNLALGLCAIVLLILSFLPFIPSAANQAILISVVVLAVALIACNIFIRSKGPASYTHYCARSVDGKKKYRFMNYNKRKKYFSNGENVVESDGVYVRLLDNLPHEEYLHDFFLKLRDVKKVVGEEFTEYSGIFDCKGKTLKAKLRLKNGVMYDANVNGARLKFFDINDEKEKYYVSPALEDAVKAAKVIWPTVKSVSSSGSNSNK